MQLNDSLAMGLERQGIRLEKVDRAAFRARLGSAFYARWRERCGTAAWRLLQEAVGRLD